MHGPLLQAGTRAGPPDAQVPASSEPAWREEVRRPRCAVTYLRSQSPGEMAHRLQDIKLRPWTLKIET